MIMKGRDRLRCKYPLRSVNGFSIEHLQKRNHIDPYITTLVENVT